MGTTPIADITDVNQQKNGSLDMPLTDRACGVDFKSYEIPGLASDRDTSPTGMREEVMLLSWLIVLLRTRESSQVRFDWTYKSGLEHETANGSISVDKVMESLQDCIEKVSAAVLDVMMTVAPVQRTAVSGHVSLLLSTSSLSKSSEEVRDEGVLHFEVYFANDRLGIRLVWHSKNVPQFTVERHIDILVETVRRCISNPDASIEDCLQPTLRDLDDIWGWNHALPTTYDFCMHDLISERAQKSLDKMAIFSWDGSLTYAQIDQYSTFIAYSLKEAGVELHDVVPACFAKSRWTIVAVLAVMKVGATFALMDPTLPLARLQNMAAQVGAKTMLTSRKQHGLSTSILPGGTYIVVEDDTFPRYSTLEVLPKLAPVPPSALMYIIFTSGSTGTPKGVTISHRTYTSSAIPRAKAVGYSEDWRVLDFASYAFDVSIDSMLLTVANGGCLCIPSDEDRLNDINEVMRKMQVNYAGITPSVARILEPDVIASLHALGLGGEAASARDVALWGRRTRIVIGYGPCECTIGCTVNSSAATGRDYISIGTGNGANIWIVDPNDHDSLAPVGAVGELLVEGPIVGQGYLNDPDKTAAAFIEDPSWLVAGWKGHAGRCGRLYKTGDLGRYDPDGSGGIVFAGRKDTQVKLRGQRVELGEIESQLRAGLPSDISVIAEVIVPQGCGVQHTLVAFVAPQTNNGYGDNEIRTVQPSKELRAMLSKVDVELAKAVPRYMVPTAYVPVNRIPVLISGKIDRKTLRQFGRTVDLRQIDQGTTSAARELSDLEKRLRQAWSQVLSLDVEDIRTDDNFFALGGDSVAAMRLVSVCRDHGLGLSVTSTFGNPILSAMAGVANVIDSQTRLEVAPFSMISQDVDSARREASRACETDQTSIEDIYPSTPTQQSLFTFALKSTKAYIAQRVARISPHVDLNAWKRAWEEVVAANPILRSRLAQVQEPGLQQIVLKEGITWRHSSDLAQYLEDDRKEKMELGQSLSRYAIVTPPNDGTRYMVWTIHHVLYDGWSEPLLLEQVRNLLQHQPTQVPAQMKDFVKWVRRTDDVATREFWQGELQGAVGPQFPRLPSRDYLPTPNAMIERQISLEMSARSPFTMATVIRGAWALVASKHAENDDVVFGETLTGRDISLPGVESIVGPLIATVPVRICIQRSNTIEAYLQAVQQGVLARTPYQHMGFQNIRRVSQDAQIACETGTGLVIQPEPEYVGDDLGFTRGDVVREALHFNAYPVMLAFGIQKGSIRVCASFDKSLVDVAQMRRILAQLEVVCSQLTRGPLSRRVGQISCLPEAEIDQIWRWNQTPPLSFEESSQSLRTDENTRPGSIYPRAVIPWVCDPQNPSLLSPIGCVGELWLEGNFLPGESVESPAWLVTGSSTCVGRMGRVQPTGDMVQLLESGSLVFVRRKDAVLRIQGHVIDLAELKSHFSRHLTPNIRTAVAVITLNSDNRQRPSEQELVVFVEQPASEGETVEIMPAGHNFTSDGEDVQIVAKIPASLTVALKKLDKSIHDSLMPYMVPFAYIIVDKIPTATGQSHYSFLSQLISSVPRELLSQLREGMKKAWVKTVTQPTLTRAEDVLRSSWAGLLGVAPEQIDVDDNFFRLGGDSVLAMKLVSTLRAQGFRLSVADIFQHMRLCDAAKVMTLNSAPAPTVIQPYKPFSTLSQVDVDAFLSQVVRPKIADPRWTVQDVYPVTDTQSLDVGATVNAPRTSVQYTMLYFEEVDQERLLYACNELVKTNDILRTVFIQAGSDTLQVVLKELDVPLATQQADRDLEQYVADLCTVDIDADFALGSPFLKIVHIQGAGSQSCLVIRLSHAQYDGVSLPRLLQDLDALYTGAAIINFEPYSSYIAHTHDTRLQDPALTYWRDLLAGSTPSVFVGPSAQPADKALFLSHPVDMSQRPHEATTATLLAAAWALVLARRLRTSDVVFGSITSGRTADLGGVENVIGPCYAFTPVRVRFQARWTTADLLRAVQRQSAESAAHDFVGFRRIAAAVGWSTPSAEETCFDSVIHYQDAEEDFDTMPFGRGTCKVDVAKPHGDAARPLKAVSFVRGGQTHVGVCCSERDPAFADAVLEQLVAAVRELTAPPSESLVLDG